MENIIPYPRRIEPHNLLEDLLPLESCKNLLVMLANLLIQNVVNQKMSDHVNHCHYPNQLRI